MNFRMAFSAQSHKAPTRIVYFFSVISHADRVYVMYISIFLSATTAHPVREAFVKNTVRFGAKFHIHF